MFVRTLSIWTVHSRSDPAVGKPVCSTRHLMCKAMCPQLDWKLASVLRFHSMKPIMLTRSRQDILTATLLTFIYSFIPSGHGLNEDVALEVYLAIAFFPVPSLLGMADPVYLFLVAHLLLAYGLAELKPYSLHRYTFLLLISICCWNATQSPLVQSIPGGTGLVYTIGFVFHSTNFLCIVKLEPPLQTRGRYRWALSQVFNPRWHLRYKPSFRIPPSKWNLIARRLLDAAWLGALLYIVRNYRLNIYSEDLLDIPDGTITWLASISARELVIRVYLTFSSWYQSYSTLRIGHCVASVIALSFNGDPSEWPPLFGSFSDAYTVRNYYA